MTRLEGGEVNDNWKLTSPDGPSWVLRQYGQTADPAELDCELAAVDALAQRGFPTPVPKAVAEERWQLIDDRPTALFDFVDGRHPQQRSGGYGSLDLELGRAAAGLAARMHLLLADVSLPGQRSPGRDPLHRVDGFLAGDTVERAVFGDLIMPLREIRGRVAALHDDHELLPTGLIHNDISPPNLLLDEDGSVAALLDFDDSAQAFLGYELGPIISNFGKDDNRRIDLNRVAALIAAYDEVRPLSAAERRAVPDLLAIQAGAEGIGVITNWLNTGRVVADPMESYSAQQFLDLLAARDDLQSMIN